MLIYCLNCSSSKETSDNRAKFCSKPCSASFNNRVRKDTGYIVTESTRQKLSILAKNQIRILKPRKTFKLSCELCSSDFISVNKHKKLCSDGCFKKVCVEVGKINASKRNVRSKQEIELSELCKSYFFLVENNKIISTGWDADILVNGKYCIFWDGPWHYKEMPGLKHSLKQTQNRDKIKKELFESLGYTVFTFRDNKYTPKEAFNTLKSLID